METTNRKSEPSAPRGLQEAPRGPQEAPRGPKMPKRDPKRPQNDSKTTPESLQEALERHPTRSQRTSTKPQSPHPGTVADVPKAIR